MDDEEAFMVNKADDDLILDLPPGFRFHPTDHEIITHYLKEKVLNSSFSATAIGEADLNKSEPWDLPKKAKMGEKEWYFFCQRDRKYPTGMRTNRATQSGYWKATGKDKEIYDMIRGKSKDSHEQLIIGMKKTLVFYTGRAPKGEKTNWVMHEYRLDGKFSYYNLPKTPKEEWVVSRVFHKSTTGIKKISILDGGVIGDDDDLLLLNGASSLPPLVDLANNYSSTSTPAVSSFTDCDDDFKVMSNTRTVSSSANAACRLSDYSRNDYVSYFSTPNNQPQSRLQQLDQNTYFQPSSNNYNYHPTTLTTENSIFGRSQIPLQNPPFPFQSAPINPAGYLYQQDKSTSTEDFKASDQTFGVLERHCKVEQFSSSNQTMAVSFASQDTGLSTDMNTAEISSSVVSKHDIAGRSNRPSYEYLDDQGPSSVGPNMAEFACLWDY